MTVYHVLKTYVMARDTDFKRHMKARHVKASKRGNRTSTYNKFSVTMAVHLVINIDRSASSCGHGQFAALCRLEFPYYIRVSWMSQDLLNVGSRLPSGNINYQSVSWGNNAYILIKEEDLDLEGRQEYFSSNVTSLGLETRLTLVAFLQLHMAGRRIILSCFIFFWHFQFDLLVLLKLNLFEVSKSNKFHDLVLTRDYNRDNTNTHGKLESIAEFKGLLMENRSCRSTIKCINEVINWLKALKLQLIVEN